MRVLLALAFLSAVFAQDPSASADPKQRVKTAKSLAREGSAGLPKLKPFQQDSSVDVRRAAVESIVTIGGQQTLEPLLFSLGDGDPEVQQTAINGLVNFYLPGYYQPGWRARLKRTAQQVGDRFGDKNEPIVPAYVTVRPEITQALGKMAAENTSMEARATAIRALGVLRAEAATEQILSALQTKNTDILYEVLLSLEKIRKREVAPRIFYMLRDPDEKVQIAAIETVSVLGNKDANDPLREAWSRTKSDRVKRALLEAMAMLPDEKNRPLFDQHLLHQDEYLRAGAAEGLGRLGKPEDRARLETLWEGERKMRPRLSLAFAVVNLGNRELSELSPLQYLINTLNSRAWSGVAEGFLKDLATEAAVRYHLHNAILRGMRAEKIALASILSERGAKDSLEVLETVSKDPDAEAANAASQALRVLRLRLQ